MSIAQDRIRVLFMQSQDYYGADSQIHGLIMRYLDRDRFEVHVACNAGEGSGPGPALAATSALDDVHVRAMSFGPTAHGRPPGELLRATATDGGRAVADLAGLVGYARRHRIDVVHATEKPRDAFYGTLLARTVGARSLVHLHVKVESWMSPLTMWALRHADALVGVSPFVTASAGVVDGDGAHSHTVLNALDVDAWEPYPDDGSVRREFAVEDGAALLVVASRLFPWKGHGDLLRALAQVRRSGRRFHLLVVGEDDPRATPGGGSYAAQLGALSRELALDDVVTFTGFRTDVRRLMNACDVFTMPSFEEPFGMVYLEAMAVRKPVVALDNGGAREVVADGVTGLLSPPGDIAALARNIARLVDDDGLRRSMGAAGRRRLDAHFRPPRMAADIERVYEELAPSRAGRRGGSGRGWRGGTSARRPGWRRGPVPAGARRGGPRATDG